MQRRITERLPGLAKLSYSERLKYLYVPSLELRRLHTDLCWRYDLQNYVRFRPSRSGRFTGFQHL